MRRGSMENRLERGEGEKKRIWDDDNDDRVYADEGDHDYDDDDAMNGEAGDGEGQGEKEIDVNRSEIESVKKIDAELTTVENTILPAPIKHINVSDKCTMVADEKRKDDVGIGSSVTRRITNTGCVCGSKESHGGVGGVPGWGSRNNGRVEGRLREGGRELRGESDRGREGRGGRGCLTGD